jgi:hypothetical protein
LVRQIDKERNKSIATTFGEEFNIEYKDKILEFIWVTPISFIVEDWFCQGGLQHF